MPEIFTEEEIVINNNFLDNYIYRILNSDFFRGIPSIEDWRNDYLSSFLKMAKKGFVSIDKTNISDYEDPMFHLVCYPKRLEKIEGIELPILDNNELADQILKMESFPLLPYFSS